MENKDKEILFVAQYPENVSPGQRFRFELYKDLLKEYGFKIATHSFLKKKGYNIIHRRGLFFNKLWEVIKGYMRRIRLLFSVHKYGYIFLQREAAPLGPPVFEWFCSKVFGKKVIYDFDDAIWMEHISDNNSMAKRFKSVHKVKNICKWSYKVSCGNEYLCNYARKYNSNVVYNPTCVDTEKRHNILACHDVSRVTIGWTGSFSTLKYIEAVTPVLKKLQDKYDFDIKIICNQKPQFDLKNLYYVEWSEENEVKELATCQIGLMPLTKDEWSEGKCGFKLIQYLALGIPAVSSPVGVNKRIVDDGVNGILCETQEEWYNGIEKLLNEKELRKKMGEDGRRKIIKSYSLLSNKKNFLDLFS
jgi:glycosyltransferase involved in cell wall biosynthesis